MANYWNHILNTALLGTDKQTPDLSQLPEVLQNTVNQVDKKDKEAYFYAMAALAWQYRRAGAMPHKPDFLEIKPAETEEKPYCTAAGLSPFKKILAEDTPNPALLEMWLDKCIQKGWILPPDMLIHMLNIAAGLKKDDKRLQPKIKEVIGKRGLWLQQFNAVWSFLKEVDYMQNWDEGKTAERKDAFIYFRKTNPSQARELLQKTWESEGIATKRDLLWEMKINLSTEDEPFLQEIYDNLVKVREKKKDTNTDLLRIVVELLFLLPSSALSINTFEKVKTYLKTGKEKKLLGLVSGKPKLELPAKEDEFFNPDYISQHFGFDKISNKVSTHTDIEYWFEELVRLIAPELWQEYLSVSAEDTVKIFAKSEGFTKKINNKEHNLFLYNFADSVAIHKSTAFVQALIPEYKDNLPIQVFYLMQGTVLEKYLLELNTWSIGEKTRLPVQHTEPWSLELSEKFFKEITKNNQYNYYQDKQLIDIAIPFLHPKVIRVVPDLLREEAPDWQKQQWQTQIVQPLAKMLEIRQEIETL